MMKNNKKTNWLSSSFNNEFVIDYLKIINLSILTKSQT